MSVQVTANESANAVTNIFSTIVTLASCATLTVQRDVFVMAPMLILDVSFVTTTTVLSVIRFSRIPLQYAQTVRPTQ
jgi:hypothetical protein